MQKPRQRHLDYARFADLIRHCGNHKALNEGKQIHRELAAKGGYDKDTFLGNLLVQMYAKCGSVLDAREAFDAIDLPNVYSWNMMTVAYAQNGHLEESKAMLETAPIPNTITWNTVISGCARHGQVMEARRLFEIIPHKDVVSWNCIISAYAQNAHPAAALELYNKMNLEGIRPTSFTYVSALEACAALGSLRHGKRLHSDIQERPATLSSELVLNSLVYMYSKCGSLEKAIQVFYRMPQWNVVSFNIMIAAYADNRKIERAALLFHQMPERSSVTWNAMISHYADNGCVEQAMLVFHEMPDKNDVSWNSLLAALGQANRIHEAETVFNSMGSMRNLVSWNTMTTAYTQAGLQTDALTNFYRMNLEGVHADRISFINAVNACTSYEQGRRVHTILMSSPCLLDAGLATCLIVMYTQCGCLAEARCIMDRLCQWDLQLCTAMVNAYAASGELEEAKRLFDGLPVRDVVCWTTMVVAYSQQGRLEEAKGMFDEMPYERDTVAWNAILTAYAQQGRCEDTIACFPVMEHEGVRPDRATFVVVFYACSALTSLVPGRRLHVSLMDAGIEAEYTSWATVGSSLVNMYGRCGEPEEARKVFDGIVDTGDNVVVWSAMLAAYCANKMPACAFDFFKLMSIEGVEPDRVTFMSLLTLCSHSGLRKDAGWVFRCIPADYGMAPSMEHYICMVDMLARMGNVGDAEELLRCMPFEPDVVCWTALLGACKLHGQVQLAAMATGRTIELCPSHSFSYSLLSSICSQSTMVDVDNNDEDGLDCILAAAAF